MISPEEIRQQAAKWWTAVLQSHIQQEPFFPKSIDRIGKVSSAHVTGRFEALQQEIELLYRHSKNETGSGYLIKTTDKNFRRTGTHALPDQIVFETAEDYVQYVGRKKEWKTFLQNYEQAAGAMPLLKEWLLTNTGWLTRPQTDWPAVLAVCIYFIATPRPNLYLRQLPLEIHTKFIEENDSLIQSLLNFLIPGHIRNPEQKRFAERYFLRYDEPLVRIRVLDDARLLLHHLNDISIPLSDFKQIDWPVSHILIAENKMNFLTLPALPSTIAVWSGGGFNISYLKGIGWLGNKRIVYWGDIDEHGFQILHQLRSYHPQTESVLMDRGTFELFSPFAVDGPHSKWEHLSLLNEQETALYQHLKSLHSKNRLEQEKIPQAYAEKLLYELL